MGNVSDIEAARLRRREAAKLGDFGEPENTDWIVMPIARTSDGVRRVAIIAPAAGHEGHSLSPDQARAVAADLLREADACEDMS